MHKLEFSQLHWAPGSPVIYMDHKFKCLHDLASGLSYGTSSRQAHGTLIRSPCPSLAPTTVCSRNSERNFLKNKSKGGVSPLLTTPQGLPSHSGKVLILHNDQQVALRHGPPRPLLSSSSSSTPATLTPNTSNT